MNRKIKCKFCDWEIPTFGQKRNSFFTLQEHIFINHYRQWNLIQSKIEEDSSWEEATE